MTPYFETGDIQIYHGDAREVLSDLSVEATACVTDPPYGLGDEPDPADVMRAWADGTDPDVGGGGFMGEDWDSFVPAPNTFEAIYGSLLPGAPMLCFAGSRTADWMGMSLRFAGFERRDTIQYLFGSGFPKSHDISKAIDDAKGAKREVVGESKYAANRTERDGCALNAADDGSLTEEGRRKITAPATGEAETWDGYGTALAPAHEPIILAMKPKEKTFAHNAQKHGTAGLNIDQARIGMSESDKEELQAKSSKNPQPEDANIYGDYDKAIATEPHEKGRWPANVVLDEAAAELVDEQSGQAGGNDKRDTPTGTREPGFGGVGEADSTGGNCAPCYDDTGGASRFFFTHEQHTNCLFCQTPINESKLICKPANGAVKSSTDAQGNDSAQKDAQGNTQHASEGTNPNKPLSASSAARILRNTPAKTASIVQRNVTERHVAKNALSVRSVANVCPKCATHIARAVVQAKTKTERSTPTLEYIEGRRKQILNQSLALIAESQGSTDTILTTPTLKMWYGYVQRAIENGTKRANPKTSGRSETSRFLYTAKASKSDRNAGLPPGEENDHPTVKPTDLMGWLLRLVEMPGQNLILDPFCGSGTTLYVAQQMGLPAIGVDQDEESCELASKRLSEPSLFS